MFGVAGNSMDEILKKIIAEIMTNGEEYSPRNMLIREINGCHFRLDNPRNRIIYNPERRFSLTFALGEFLWYLAGKNDLETILYYNGHYDRYSDDGQTLYGAYGKRIFGDDEKCQVDRIIELLRKDKDTRQAVISIYNSNDNKNITKDVPCTCTLQFLIRNNRLNCITYMRSNDLILGTVNDIFSFTMLQELVANEVGVEIGWYEHIAGSMHIYKEHYELARKIFDVPLDRVYTMPNMPDNARDKFQTLLKNEKIYRHNLSVGLQEFSDDYFKDLDNILKFLSYKKRGEKKLQEEIRERIIKNYVGVIRG